MNTKQTYAALAALLMLVTGGLVMGHATFAVAQGSGRFLVWERVSPCADKRVTWFTAASRNPRETGSPEQWKDVGLPAMSHTAAAAEVEKRRVGAGFDRVCCRDWAVLENQRGVTFRHTVDRQDRAGQRIESNTPQRCLALCRKKLNEFASVQSDDCICSDAIGTPLPAENCNEKCSGDPIQACGGKHARSVYQTGVIVGPPVPEESSAERSTGPGTGGPVQRELR